MKMGKQNFFLESNGSNWRQQRCSLVTYFDKSKNPPLPETKKNVDTRGQTLWCTQSLLSAVALFTFIVDLLVVMSLLRVVSNFQAKPSRQKGSLFPPKAIIKRPSICHQHHSACVFIQKNAL